MVSDRRQTSVEAQKGSPSQESESAEASRPQKRIEILFDGVPVEVSPELEAAVHRAHQGVERELPKEMTTTQAAAFLDVSRPFVIKLMGLSQTQWTKQWTNEDSFSERVAEIHES
jgi:RecB family exonuclease